MRLILAVLFCFWFAPALLAQEFTFIPKGVFSSSVKHESLSWSDTLVSHRNRQPNAVADLLQLDLAQDQLAGGLNYQMTQQTVDLLYGVTDQWNFGLQSSYIRYTRKSTLVNSSPANQDLTDYVASVSSKQVSGLGDTQLYLHYRHFYTDYAQLVSGFFYQEPTGHVEYNQSSPMNLGTGLRRMGYRLIWDGFFSQTRLYTHSVAQIGFDGPGVTLGQDGKRHKLKGGVANQASVEAIHQLGLFHYGAGAGFFFEPVHIVGKHDVRDGQLSVDAWLQIGIGNLAWLEKGPVSLPWTGSLQVKQAYRGNNVPAGQRMIAKLTLYF